MGTGRICGVAAAAIAVAVAGCASPVARRDASRPAPDATGRVAQAQGGAWEAVLPGPAAAAEWPGAEEYRRDGVLAIREPEALTWADEWPQPARPALSRARRLFIPDDADRVLYFREERVRPWWPRRRW